ncbi:hypothetical protein PVK06_043507 [Gossypium arboreum]|uniref:Retrotransposon gag domain-containing protein n=1 Tax=Gossypium arboreum TaxID=29729 RepID=A0ABR0MNU8_GOSAR|nr:hypothetical protein PVK06_043507 [Gossypium arboreum]
MTKKGVTTHVQKEVNILQQEMVKYFGSSGSANNEAAREKEKGILRRPPLSFPPKEIVGGSHHRTPSMVEGDPNRALQEVLLKRNYITACPHFDGSDFRAWWIKLRQYFEAKASLKVFNWTDYGEALRERFGSNTFRNPMSELVSLKQQGSVESYHDSFVSLLNQLNLSEPYALDIFVSNLKHEVSQYLQLFEHQTLAEGFKLARKVEVIVSGTSKRVFLRPLV